MWNDIEKIVGVLAGERGKRTKTTLGSKAVSSARDLELAVQEGLPSEFPTTRMYATKSFLALLSLVGSRKESAYLLKRARNFKG